MGVEVEIEGEDGSKLAVGVRKGQNTVIGRGCGFNTTDRSVSRRHVSFQLDSDSEPRVSFEVIGRNPFWVWPIKEERALRVFRKLGKGHLELGDRFSLSGKIPIWFHFNDPTQSNEVAVAEPHSESETETEVSSSRADLHIDQIDLSRFDPVKEFGFIVMGHEFDGYPQGKIRNVKDWEWFLEEPSKDSDEEEDEGKQRRRMRRKPKKGKDNEDEEWGGESEEDKDLVAKISKGKRPRYSTRSKDRVGPSRDTQGGSTSSERKKASKVNETVEEEDDDETLGGFIVDDEEDDQQQQEEEEEDDEEEEEEFEDDDNED